MKPRKNRHSGGRKPKKGKIGLSKQQNKDQKLKNLLRANVIEYHRKLIQARAIRGKTDREALIRQSQDGIAYPLGKFIAGELIKLINLEKKDKKVVWGKLDVLCHDAVRHFLQVRRGKKKSVQESTKYLYRKFEELKEEMKQRKIIINDYDILYAGAWIYLGRTFDTMDKIMQEHLRNN